MTMNKSGLKGLLFDKDGVLFDFQASWGVWAARMITELCGSDITAQRRLAKAIDFDLTTQSFRPESVVIAGTSHEAAAAFAKGLPYLSFDKINAHLLDGALTATMQPSCDLPRLFAELKQGGYVIGLATNDAEAAARRHLEDAGALEYFDFVSGSDSGFGAKPEPGMCLGFCDATGLNPNTCVMVGDSAHDLHAASSAGMAGVGVLTGVATRADLEPLAVAVLPSIADLPDWLGKT